MVFCNTLAAFTFIALAAMTSPAAAQAPVVRNCGKLLRVGLNVLIVTLTSPTGGPNDIIKVADITLTPAHPGPGEQVTLVTNTHVASQVSVRTDIYFVTDTPPHSLLLQGGRAQVTVTVHGQQVFHDDRDFCDVVYVKP